MKTSWDLSLFYTNHNDPRIEADVLKVEKSFASFAKKYKNKTEYLKTETALLRALTDFEALFKNQSVGKPLRYFHFTLDLNSGDTEARAKSQQYIERFTKADNLILFFELSLATISKPLQKKFLKSKKLAPFRYYLKRIFDTASHNLSLPEEKILSLKSNPAHGLWIDTLEKLLNTQTVPHNGTRIPVSQAVFMIGDLPLVERRRLHSEVITVMESLALVAESEINAVVTNKKIDDELRGYVKPYDATISRYQNDPKSVLSLVKTVTDNMSVSHRFFNLKAKLLSLPHLTYADRNVGIGTVTKKISFTDSVALIKKIFKNTHPDFEQILDRFLAQGQIDVFPKVGKTGGAYCAHSTNQPTMVLLNDVETFDSVSTFAHEMGHAIHSEYSKSQPVFYQDYSIATAEVASTFFESVVFDAVYETLSPEEKIVALHTKINDDIQTIFRQIACFNFECDLHAGVRERGALSKEDIAKLMNTHMSSYLGPITKMDPKDGYYFVQWSHIRNFFYVYSYAFGQLISKALYAHYKADKTFITKIQQFLSAGGSDSPERIFASIGIDVTKSDFWQKGIDSIAKDIATLEKLTKNR